MDARPAGMAVVVAGVVIVVVGLLIMSGGLGWFGRLPGDFRIERGNTRIHVPVVSMLIASVVISVVLWIVRRFS